MILFAQMAADVKDGRKARGWCLTYNVGVKKQECSDEDFKAGCEEIGRSVTKITADTAVQHFVCQLESAPDTGMLHVQAYVGFYNARRFSTVQFWCGQVGFPGAHLEIRRGTPQQAWDYCTKADSRAAGPWEHGNRPVGSGDRSDLKSFISDASKLKTGQLALADLQDTHPSIEARYTKYFDRVVARSTPSRDFQTYCAVFYGDSGTGKSFSARKWCEERKLTVYHLRLPETRTAQLFFERYAGEPVVIVDEMGPNRMSLQEFNSLIDSHPHLVNVKGASAPFLSHLIIFTSNIPPDDWFTADERLRQTVRRRINWCVRYRYHPDHKPDGMFSNGDEVLANVQVDTLKDDTHIEQWAEEAHVKSALSAPPVRDA